MTRIARTYWPVLLGLFVFLSASVLVQMNLDALTALLSSPNPFLAMGAYILIGIVTVMVPFGTLLPFIPVAVSVWGWVTTALLTTVAWTIGSHLLFEAARRLGQPFIEKFVAKKKLDGVKNFMNHHTFVHALLLRTFVHGDLVSYAFGIFTDINRWRYLIVTSIAVTPTAFFYAYFGKLPVQFQIGVVISGAVLILGYLLAKQYVPDTVANVARAVDKLGHALTPRRLREA